MKYSLCDNPEETYNSSSLICPYCKFEHECPWEMDLKDWLEVVECDRCEKKFKARVEYSADYIGEPIDE